MHVRFYAKSKQNNARSAAEGRPIFDEVEMADVRIPGDKHFNPHFPAHEPTVSFDRTTMSDDTRTWAERYSAEYKAFKSAHLPSVSGTPLEEWPILSRAKVSELKALDITTVEQIAEISDRNRNILGPSARQMITQAQVYIAQARDAAPANQMAAENAELRTEVDAMRAEMDRLRAEMAPKRGRPRKEVEEEVDAA